MFSLQSLYILQDLQSLYILHDSNVLFLYGLFDFFLIKQQWNEHFPQSKQSWQSTHIYKTPPFTGPTERIYVSANELI